MKWSRHSVSWLAGAACWVAFAVYGAVGHGIRDRAVAVAGFLIIGVIWVYMGVRRAVRDARSQSGDQR